MCDAHRFEFYLARAYKEQAVEQFEQTPVHPLLEHGAPQEFGVYALYQGKKSKKPVYVGKAINTTLANRLTQHARKIQSRENIALEEMRCRYLVIGRQGEKWVASSAESELINHYKPEWNGSGFGSHVPGRGRPGTRESKWNEQFPHRRK